MATGFTLAMYPWVYTAQYNGDDSWDERFIEKPHKTPAEEDALAPAEREKLLASRNSFPELPLVNYTTQYGLGCFEGLKAFPRKDGSLKVFRPDENAKRMYNSMVGLNMPGYPAETFVNAVLTVVKRNRDLGFFPRYDAAWEKKGYLDGHSMYIRPFSYAEPGIGLNLSKKPWVVIVTTPVGSYFDPDASAKAITTEKVRAFPGGTGWIKCDANYVVPILVKKEAEKNGYMEAVFLDATEKKYVEEGSSCNIFFYLKSGTLVTPQLDDTVLPGINRKSAIEIARSHGVTVEERKITIDEVMSDAKEVFVTGTAAGIAYIESLEHNGKTAVFGDRTMGELTHDILMTLKGIQYGAVDDTFGWMFDVE